MTELKPCPFCGKEGRLIEAECGTTIYAVECVLCQAKIGWFDEKERAVECWNKRSNWHTGKPTEEGWYLLKLNHDGEPKYNANYLWDIGFGKEWKYAYLGEVIKWQKIEED